MPRIKNTHTSRVAALLADNNRQLHRALSKSTIELAYAMAANARDYATDRFEAMDFAQCCLDAIDLIPDRSTQLLVISGPLAEAKAKWDL